MFFSRWHQAAIWGGKVLDLAVKKGLGPLIMTMGNDPDKNTGNVPITKRANFKGSNNQGRKAR
ncbi:hypothetical protein AN476_07695 [Phaeobacter sp. 11ANDIMAR09]|nr:hypothetical protein AN476_07695 [Phaeobacter sp. 11ANDIMAR09]OIQ34482.1 MAG: hypothetical protein BM559_05610 [Roseobacter sp. MedPE-SWchi]